MSLVDNYLYLCTQMDYTINVQGRLLDLTEPLVMGILNVTPDSFYAGSRQQTEREIAERASQIVAEGGAIIDIGGCSTRPGAQAVTEAEEMERLRFGLEVVRREQPDSIISVDTFRPDVARMAVEEYGAGIVNDVSEGDGSMFRMVSNLRVPYILMSQQPTITLDHNYELLAHQEMLNVFELPLLVGVSRKSMIYKLFGVTPQESLNGTTALNTIALMKGASILRVHDVREAVECVRIVGRV